MKKFKNYALAATGVVALALTITFMNTNHAGAQQAVAQQAVAPPPQKPPKPPAQVEVVNPVLAVFDIDNARQPFQISMHVTPNASSPSFIVPADKRLVIEHVSIFAEGSLPGYLGSARLTTSVNSVSVQHNLSLPAALQTSSSRDVEYSASLAVRIYADTGTRVEAYIGNNSNLIRGDVKVSGYLVDVSKFEGIPF